MQINVTINIDGRFLTFLKKKKNLMIIFLLLFVLLGITLYSADVITKPWNFSSGDLIDADKINDNFDVLYTKVNELASTSTDSTGLGDYQEVLSETLYHAETDGFVFGVASKNNNQTIAVQSNVISFYLSSETFNPYSPSGLELSIGTPWYIPAKTNVQLPFCYPVKKGKYWAVRFYTDEEVYWVPMGN